MPAGDVERDAPQLRTALKDGKGDDGAMRLDVRPTVVRIRINGV